MAKKIYEPDAFYSFLRRLTDPSILNTYRKHTFVGMEKLPKDGPVIYAPNHCCALMDPLTVLIMNSDTKVFVARADIFNNPTIHKILTFLKIMPINRLRDGIRNMTKAGDTIEKSIEVLEHGVDFCIMPEGTHRSMHSLMPIGKGVARIACGTLQGLPEETPLYIVPVGLEYSDYYRLRNTLLMHICDPINVRELLAAHPGISEHDAMELIREKVGESLKKNIVYIEDNEDYDAVWQLSRIASGKVPESKLLERFRANKEAVAKIEKYRLEHHDEAQGLFDRVLAFDKRRKAAKVSLGSLHRGRTGLKAVLCTLLSLVTLPLFLIAAVLSLPLWLSSELLIRNMKDRTFRNSFRCGIIFFGSLLLFIIYAIVFFCCFKWYWALLALALFIPSPYEVYDYFELIRMTASHWRCLFNGKLREEYNKIADDLKKI